MRPAPAFRLLLLFLAVAAVAVAAAGCGRASRPVGQTAPPEGMRVIASFYTLRDFTERIGGGFVKVGQLVPAGVEPHDWEPSAGMIADIAGARVFIYNGAGLEPWVEEVLPGLDRKRTLVVEATAGLDLLAGDPHVWLDPLRAKQQVALIRDALSAADPAHAGAYRANADELLERLDGLDRQYREGLAGCRLSAIVVSHNAFGYLAKRYGFEVVGLSGPAFDAEPGPRRMARIAGLVREQGMEYVFFEPLGNPGPVRAVAEEAGAGLLPLDPLEGIATEEEARGRNYFTVMDENLANLRLALGCER